MAPDRSALNICIGVSPLPESDVYDIKESEYVRPRFDEDVKESRLQGLKHRPAASDNGAEQLREEIEDLEQRIDDLTSFRTGVEMQG